MSAEYDTGRIRELARRIGLVADAVADVDTNTLNAARNEIPGNFVGSAAEALTDSVEELSRDIRTLSGGLGELRDALYALARRVDAADAAAKALIASR